MTVAVVVRTALAIALAPGGAASATGGGEGAAKGGGAAGARAGEPRSGGSPQKQLHASLQKLHATNVAEIAMAHLALEKSASPRVQEYAQHLGEEHRQLDFQLRQVAGGLGAELGNLEGATFRRMIEAADRDLQALRGKSGAAFDQAFLAHMATAQRRAVAVADVARTLADRRDHPELQAYLVGASRSLTAHLDHAKQLSAAFAHGGPATGGERADASGSASAGSASAGSTGAAGSGSAAPPHGADRVLTGIVASVTPDQGRIVIAPDVGRSAELSVVPQTRIVVDGRVAQLQDVFGRSDCTSGPWRLHRASVHDSPVARVVRQACGASVTSDAR